MGVTTEDDAAEYAEWLLAQVSRCAELGVELPYLSVANEPSYNRNTMTGEFIRDVIKVLGPMLRAAGFGTMIVLADDLNPTTTATVATPVLADEEARSYVGALPRDDDPGLRRGGPARRASAHRRADPAADRRR